MNMQDWLQRQDVSKFKYSELYIAGFFEPAVITDSSFVLGSKAEENFVIGNDSYTFF